MNDIPEIFIDDPNIIAFKFSSKTSGIYKTARLDYHNAKKGETYTIYETDYSVEGTEKVLYLRTRAESLEQAREIARNSLQRYNIKEISGSITLIGDTSYLAGIYILCLDFGLFSGKYFIERVTHSVSRSGYTTELFLQMGQEAKQKLKTKKSNSKTQGVSEIYYEGDEYYRRSE